MKYAHLLLLVFALVSLSCDSQGSEHVGTVVDVGCGGASSVTVGGEVFDFRPANNCGNGLVRYVKSVTSESGDVTADFQIACGPGFCISQVKVNSWEEN